MTDREDRDEGLTSEDLVARARERFLKPDDDTLPSETETVGSSLPETPGEPSTVDDYTDFLKEQRAPTPQASDEARAHQEQTAVEAEPSPTTSALDDEQLDGAWSQPRPSQDTRGWDPSWTPETPANAYGGGPPVGGPDPSVLPPPPEHGPAPRRGSRRWIVGLLVFGGFVLFNVVGSGVFSSGTAVDRLETGQCLIYPEAAEFTTVETVDCGEPHDYEVYGDVTLVFGGAYPGEQQVLFQAYDSCIGRFDSYVGSAYATSIYEIEVFYPVESSWEAGDRSATCLVYEPGSTATDVTTRTGSLRNAGR